MEKCVRLAGVGTVDCFSDIEEDLSPSSDMVGSNWKGGNAVSIILFE